MFETVVMFLFLSVVFLLFSNFSKSHKLKSLENAFYDTTVHLRKSINMVEADMRSKMKSLEASPSEDTTASNEEYEAETFESDDLIEVAFTDGYVDSTGMDWFKAVFVQCSSVNGETHVWLRMGNETAQSFPLSKVVLAKIEEKKPS